MVGKTTITTYLGGSIYQNDTLLYLPHEEGRIRVNAADTGYIFDYFVKDHLGNTRMVLTDDGNRINPILEATQYYPFGLIMKVIGKEAAGVLQNKFKYNGKEEQSKEFSDGTGLDYLDYGARMYDAQIGRWMNIDLLSDLSRRWSPFTYCYNNPIRVIDPDGMFADFINEDGKKIGSDGVDDKKLYVIKTSQKKFDSEAPSAGITKNEAKATEEFIKKNSGNIEAFKANDIAYKNSVEIEPNTDSRQAMVDIVSKDNGKGGTADANNREYGGRILSTGEVIESPAGPVANPLTNPNAHIDIISSVNQSTFHSHPSGANIESTGGANTIGGATKFGSFQNAPSNIGGDIQNSGSRINYVFSRGNNTVYIYNNTGVIATLPIKNFVAPKK
jgi:RHS repeat-associated protein